MEAAQMAALHESRAIYAGHDGTTGCSYFRIKLGIDAKISDNEPQRSPCRLLRVAQICAVAARRTTAWIFVADRAQVPLSVALV